MKVAMARSVAHLSGTASGPLALVMVAFGLDPMTARATALAAGHGFVAGWTLAITGDMLYYGLIAVTTLGLNTCFHNPATTMWVVLGGMFFLPVLVRQVCARVAPARSKPGLRDRG
jgi:hypothetical protein